MHDFYAVESAATRLYSVEIRLSIPLGSGQRTGVRDQERCGEMPTFQVLPLRTGGKPDGSRDRVGERRYPPCCGQQRFSRDERSKTRDLTRNLKPETRNFPPCTAPRCPRTRST